MPACINRIFGPRGRTPSRGARLEALVEVSARAGLPVWIPDDVAGSCCGLPWSSKASATPTAHMANETVERLWRWSGEGELPVVIDATSCTQAIADPGEGVLSEENAERLAGSRSSTRSPGPTTACCRRSRSTARSARRPSTRPARPATWAWRRGCAALAGALADEVYVAALGDLLRLRRRPRHLHPELTAAATAPQAAEVAGRDFDAHLSSNRTCEIGLSRATGEDYESVLLLLEELTRPAEHGRPLAPVWGRSRRRRRLLLSPRRPGRRGFASRSMRRSKSGLRSPRRAEM